MEGNRKLPKKATEKQEKKQTLVEVLKEILPAQKNPEHEIAEMKYKAQVLDANRRKWKSQTRVKSRNILSAKDIRKHSVYDLKTSNHKFKSYLPLHQLWMEYMRDILDLKRYNSKDSGQRRENNERLVKADYHGCYIVVRKSKVVSLVGQAGIVVMETKQLFKIVTKENKLKTIPKMNSVFAFQLDGFLFTIHGNHFCVNPNQRSRRKFKQKATVDF